MYYKLNKYINDGIYIYYLSGIAENVTLCSKRNITHLINELLIIILIVYFSKTSNYLKKQCVQNLVYKWVQLKSEVLY